MQKKWILISGILMLVLLQSCGMQQAYVANNGAAMPVNNGKSKKTMYYYANALLVVKTRDSAMQGLKRQSKQMGGYITAFTSKYVEVQLPADSISRFFKKAEQLGKLKHKNVSARVVADAFTNTKTKLESTIKTKDRYLALLEKAHNIEDILKIEKELERLHNTIAVLQAQQKELAQKINYAKLSIKIRKREKPGVLGYIGLGVYHGVKWLFIRS